MGSGKRSIAARNSSLSGFLTQVGNGTVGTVVRFYDGTTPAGPSSALSSNNVLAQAAGSGAGGAVWASPSNGQIVLIAPLQTAAASATGAPTFARVFRADDLVNAHYQTEIAQAGDPNYATAGLIMAVRAMTAGKTYTFNAWTITEGDA